MEKNDYFLLIYTFVLYQKNSKHTTYEHLKSLILNEDYYEYEYLFKK